MSTTVSGPWLPRGSRIERTGAAGQALLLDNEGGLMSDAVKRAVNPWAVLVVLSLGLFMTLLDLTIVNIAMH